MNLRPLFVTLMFASIACLSPQAYGFRVQDASGLGFGIGRWNALPHEVNGVERSLDGGLRYSVSGGSYKAFFDEFNWIGNPTVDEFQDAIEAAFAAWEADDPATGLKTNLRFVPDFGTPVDFAPPEFELNPGAEIDLLAMPDTPWAFAGVSTSADPNANTVTLTSGVPDYPAAVASGSDIVFNSSRRWSVDEITGNLTAAIAIAIGLQNTDRYHNLDVGGLRTRFYDDNYDGSSDASALATLTNSFAHLIDPFEPDNSPALMLYDVCQPDPPEDLGTCVGRPGIDTPGVDLMTESTSDVFFGELTADDYAARQFLYPYVRPGDLNADLMLTAEDIDLLSAEIIAPDPRPWFDLDGDGAVTMTDRDFWVHDLNNTYFGDSNLDGEFNSGDLVAVFQAGVYEDNQPMNATWATGDWNGDGDFDTGDMVFAFQGGGFETGPRQAINAVPEPSSLLIAIAAIGLVLTRRPCRYPTRDRSAGTEASAGCTR